MRIVIYSVVLNQHQAPLSDKLWELTNHEFIFVELTNLNDKKGGTEDYSKRPYLLKAWENEENYNLAMNLCTTADCCIFSGIESLPFELKRMKINKLSFEMSERWFKKGLVSICSQRLWKWLITYYKENWKKKKLYKLCCSAYCANDHYKLLTFKDKCYKWGYFTQISNYHHNFTQSGVDNRTLKIMWCARFIDWKHPEIPIKLAKKLKDYFIGKMESDYYSSFHLNMFGDGKLRSKIELMAKDLSVSDFISFHGNIPNKDIHEHMRNHDIFIFTSDRSEGWGAVANEAMSEGCILVGSDKIGSIPFLVKDRINGFIFKDQDINSLFDAIKEVISLGNKLTEISYNAYLTIHDLWSPQMAAQSLISLIEGIEKGEYNPIKSGPCSKIITK